MALHSQRGSSVLIMVMIILLLGTVMLNSTRRQLADSMGLVGDERRYLQQFTGAISALAWGERLRWPAADTWQCRRQAEFHWRACLQPALLLLRADSGPGSLALWRWVSLRPDGTLQAAPHGWLDFCPLAGENACDVE